MLISIGDESSRPTRLAGFFFVPLVAPARCGRAMRADNRVMTVAMKVGWGLIKSLNPVP